MEDLFDIAHCDAMSLITVEEDLLFLEAQGEKGRRGIMVGVDISLIRKESAIYVITPELAAALDRTNTSDRKASHILSAVTSTGQLNQDVEELIISRSAI